MLVITGGRAYGKTTKLMEWLRDADNRVLVVKNQYDRSQLLHKYDVHPSRIVTFDDLRYQRKIMGNNMIYAVDNADELLSLLIPGQRIDRISLTGSAMELPTPKQEYSMHTGVPKDEKERA